MTQSLYAVNDEARQFQVEFQTRAGSEKKGPLDVLWSLIESYEVDVFSVSLSRITFDFLQYIGNTAISLEEKADFTQIATRLIFYKSRLLLPNAVVAEETIADKLPFELVEQLLEYKKMQQAAEEMRRFEERSQLRLTREQTWHAFEKDADYLEVDLLSFLRTFKDFLEKEEKSRPMQIHDETITAEEVMDYLLTKLIGEKEASFFRSVVAFSVARIVACFLALLELAKQKVLVLRQDTWLGDIHFAHAPDYAQDTAQPTLPFEKS